MNDFKIKLRLFMVYVLVFILTISPFTVLALNNASESYYYEALDNEVVISEEDDEYEEDVIYEDEEDIIEEVVTLSSEEITELLYDFGNIAEPKSPEETVRRPSPGAGALSTDIAHGDGVWINWGSGNEDFFDSTSSNDNAEFWPYNNIATSGLYELEITEVTDENVTFNINAFNNTNKTSPAGSIEDITREQLTHMLPFDFTGEEYASDGEIPGVVPGYATGQYYTITNNTGLPIFIEFVGGTFDGINAPEGTSFCYDDSENWTGVCEFNKNQWSQWIDTPQGTYPDSGNFVTGIELAAGESLENFALWFGIQLSATQNAGVSWNLQVSWNVRNLYEGEPYTVAFDPNGLGNWNVATYTTTNNMTNGVMPSGPVNPASSTEGIIFTGWNTKADGTGTAYSATNLPTTVTSDVTFYAQWAVNVDFSLSVEGLNESVTATYQIPYNTSIANDSIIPIIDTMIADYLANILQVDSHVEAFEAFTGWLDNTNSPFDLTTLITRPQSLHGTLTLQRFTVTFVAPLVDLYGQTVQVPFGSTLIEPAIHHPAYQTPAGWNAYGWFLNVLNTVDQAADVVSSATIGMPGNSSDPTLDSRIIITPITDSISVTGGGGTVGIAPTEGGITEYDVNDNNELDISQKVAFNFNGTEASGPTNVANATRITDNKVLTRIYTEYDYNQPVPPIEDVLGATRTPNIPRTGASYLVIVTALVGLGGILVIRKKLRL